MESFQMPTHETLCFCRDIQVGKNPVRHSYIWDGFQHGGLFADWNELPSMVLDSHSRSATLFIIAVELHADRGFVGDDAVPVLFSQGHADRSEFHRGCGICG